MTPWDSAIALVDRRGELTYGELVGRIAQIRSGLVEHGVRAGDAVLIVTANERESAATYHAVVSIGAVAVLSQIGSGAAELAVACAAAQPRLIVLPPPAVDRGVAVPPGVPTVASSDLIGTRAVPIGSVDPSARRLIVFTSGTTASAKGVVHSAGSLAAAAACFQDMLRLTASDRLFLVSPLGSITGVLQALELAPIVGAAAVLEQDFDDDATLDLLIAGRGTAYGGPDVILDRLLIAAARRGVGVPLRVAALGGTMLRRELMDRAEGTFGIRVVRIYGSSEAPCSSGTRPDEPDERRLADEGVAGPGVELRVGDDGELLVRGPHLFSGYVDPADDEDATVEGWFRTGDEARLEGGRLRITGRLKDVVSRNGKKISLAEVDQAFRVASGIANCAAFAVADAQTGERVAVAVQAGEGDRIDATAVLAAMEAAGLARWKLPESIVASADPLPVTSTGKVQRRELSDHWPTLWRASRLAELDHADRPSVPVRQERRQERS